MNRVLSVWMLLIFPSIALTQAPDEVAGSDLTVSIITVGPGQDIASRAGHNAIRIQDEQRGTDHWYDYGHFDFDRPSLVVELLRARLDYWMERRESGRELQRYMRQGRSVRMQVLNLTAEQRRALQEHLEWNARLENRTFAYDFYLDNCSTRIRDALNLALGGALSLQLRRVPARHTFRQYMNRVMQGRPLTAAFLHAAQGPTIDRPVTAWEETFLPAELARHLGTVEAPPPSQSPLVTSDVMLSSGRRAAQPGPFAPAVVLSLAGLFVLGGFAGRARHARRPKIDMATAVATMWLLVSGTLGLVLWVIWGLGHYWATHWNANLLLLNPAALLVGISVLLAERNRRWTVIARYAAVVLVVCSGMGAALLLLPGGWQQNLSLVSLAFPANLVAVACVWHRRDKAAVPGTAAGPRAPILLA